MAKVNDVRDVIFDQTARSALLEGAKQVYEAVKSTYGPKGNNVILEKQFGDPILTRDGITVARDIYLEDKAQNQGAKLIIQASKKTNDRAGDGTSATVVLAYHILSEATKLVAGGYDAMELRNAITSSAAKVIQYIDTIKEEVNDKKLIEVATISCGDEALGNLIADTIIKVGANGGVTIEEHTNSTTERELVDGFYFDRGFANIGMATDFVTMKAEHTDIPILITKQKINTNAQILPILEKVAASPSRKIMIIGELGGEALATFVMNKGKGSIDGVTVGIPVFGDQETLFLEDVAVMTGARVIQEAEDTSGITAEDFGLANKIIVSESTTTILGGKGDAKAIKDRIKSIEDRLKIETNTMQRERLELRLAKLVGKIAVIRVGGSSDVAREELKFRVEDAVNATQNARKEGIVAGGGTTLLFASQIDGIDLVLQKAMKQCFTELLLNAGENAEYKTEEVLRAGYGFGYNIKSITKEPCQMFKAGVVDPALTIKQVVANASEVAGNMITAGCVITYTNQEHDQSLMDNN